jgi:hypothetical protein
LDPQHVMSSLNLTVKAELRTIWPRAGVSCVVIFMQVPKQTYLIQKKKKNARHSRGVILYQVDMGKIQTLIKAIY